MSCPKQTTTGWITTPLTAEEWAAFLAANELEVPAPNAVWLCQDASGDLTSTIGSLALGSK